MSSNEQYVELYAGDNAVDLIPEFKPKEEKVSTLVKDVTVTSFDSPTEQLSKEQIESDVYQSSYVGFLKKNKPMYDFVKRTFDIIVSLLCLTVGLPVYLIMILAIVIDDPGNPFYVQNRVGLNGRVFQMVKLRTMYKDADKHKAELKNECASDVHFKMKNDPRVTRVGKFLRVTSLDETPQMINVLLNDMSIVGPRAFIISEQTMLPADRLSVKPGLTCYWQITDTTQMTYEDQLELDYKYIRERGIATDLKLLWKTVKLIFKGGNC